MIGGFEEPDAGTIYLGEQPVTGLPPYKRDVNTVFQSYALFPHLSIFENVAFGLQAQRREGRHSSTGGCARSSSSSSSPASRSASRASSPAGSSSASHSRARS